ncbi:MAG: hypothetical protein ACQEUT_18295 [Bacillota bacterium]
MEHFDRENKMNLSVETIYEIFDACIEDDPEKYKVKTFINMMENEEVAKRGITTVQLKEIFQVDDDGLNSLMIQAMFSPDRTDFELLQHRWEESKRQ